MPEAGRQPENYEIFSMVDIREVPTYLPPDIWGALDEIAGRAIDKLNKKYGGYETRVQIIKDSVFGGFELPKGALEMGTKDERLKMHSAVVQQNLVHHLFRATTPPPGLTAEEKSAHEKYAKTWFQIIRIMEAYCDPKEAGGTINLRPFWNGVKAELAVVRALKQEHGRMYLDKSKFHPNGKYFDPAGFRVIVPDYTQDIDAISPGDTQIIWDVRYGIDLIAIPPIKDCALLVDVKGRNNVDKVQVEPMSREEPFHRLPISLKELLSQETGLDYVPVRHATIFVPTAALSFNDLRNLPDSNFSALIADFGKLTSAGVNNMIGAVNQVLGIDINPKRQ